MNQDNKLRVVLIRHGKTVYNIEKRLQGPKDRLTEEGKEQIRRLNSFLETWNFDRFISSDETRAIESSKIISEIIKKDFEKTSLIREKSSGNFSDKLIDEVDWTNVSGSFLDKKIPNGESTRDVVSRALEFFKKLNEIPQGKDILVVSHGTFLRILISLITNASIQDYLLNQTFPNTGIVILSRDNSGKWSIEKSDITRKE